MPTGGRTPNRGTNTSSTTKGFNPKLIFSQIVAMQCFHYLILGFLFQVNHVIFNTSITIDRIFTDKYLNLWSVGGWADNITVLIASMVGYVQAKKIRLLTLRLPGKRCRALLAIGETYCLMSRFSHASFFVSLCNSFPFVWHSSRAVLMAIIVEKSKKCLDFSVTLFFIHLSACVIYNGIPGTWDWWIIHILGTILMVLLGEYLCSRRELDDIPLLTL